MSKAFDGSLCTRCGKPQRRVRLGSCTCSRPTSFKRHYHTYEVRRAWARKCKRCGTIVPTYRIRRAAFTHELADGSHGYDFCTLRCEREYIILWEQNASATMQFARFRYGVLASKTIKRFPKGKDVARAAFKRASERKVVRDL